MFMGEYHHILDSKGRIIVPSKFRNELGKSFIVTRGMDGCIFIYSQQVWKFLVNKLSSLSLTDKNARSFSRFFYSGAVELDLDKQGRINLPNLLIEFAKLKSECVIIGVNTRLEIWDLEIYQNFTDSMQDKFEDISESLMDINFD